MPCKAMQKFSVRNGGMLLWGWLPPAAASAAALIAGGVAPGVGA